MQSLNLPSLQILCEYVNSSFLFDVPDLYVPNRRTGSYESIKPSQCRTNYKLHQQQRQQKQQVSNRVCAFAGHLL